MLYSGTGRLLRSISSALFSICFLTDLVHANTEKAIFLGPPTVNIPSAHPTLNTLHIDTLTPNEGQWSLRTHLNAHFPNASHPQGTPTWLLLDGLVPGQRYEVRVCWAATQPTNFVLNTYELPVVFETSELISELAEYSWSRQAVDENLVGAASPMTQATRSSDREASVLFLQILSAADYFTTDQGLMSNVPPVYVDIILDPFIGNVLPRSLINTVGYIVLVAVASWFLARHISSILGQLASGTGKEKKDQ